MLSPDSSAHALSSSSSSTRVYPLKHTPVKQNGHVRDRKGIEYSPAVKNTPVDANFGTTHLSRIPGEIIWEDAIDRGLLAIATESNPERGEKQYYKPFATVLTAISQSIYNTLHLRPDNVKPIVFIPNGNQPLTHHPAAKGSHSEYAPDVIGVYGSIENFERKVKSNKRVAGSSSSSPSSTKYWPIPYQMVLTAIEMKDEKSDGLHQAISYAPYIFEASPHISGIYVLAVKPQHYQVVWVDATGATASPRYGWKEPLGLGPLAQYVYSLYVPPARHYLVDPTIKLVSSTGDESDLIKKREGQEAFVEWNITAGDRKYERCGVKVWQYGQGRRTTVFQHLSSDNEKIMIKDAYRDDGRRFKEKDLLHQIHAKGTVPGVVRILSAFDVKAGPLDSDPPLTTAGGITSADRIIKRTKTRLVMGSCGERLNKAKSLSDLFKAVYDAVEGSVLVMERKVLHRDMSANNILMYPQHHSRTQVAGGDAFFTPKRPFIFIDEVLQGAREPNCSVIAADRARCLLIDFDNSCPTVLHSKGDGAQGKSSSSNDPKISRELGDRTGTARYIARSVGMGHTLPMENPHDEFVQMPTLEGKAKEIYIRAYGEETYKKFCDDESSEFFHGSSVQPNLSDETFIPFTHRPSHDVESIFWTMFLTLVLAIPKEDLKLGEERMEPPANVRLDQVVRYLYGHKIRGKVAGPPYEDKRGVILEWTAIAFEKTLHPKLCKKGIGKLLRELAQQVQPEYAFLNPSPHDDHLHEAFRRILLDFIVGFTDKDDVELDTDQQRDLLAAVTSDKKRQLEDSVDFFSNKKSRNGETVGSRYQSHSHSMQGRSRTGTPDISAT